MVTFPNCKINLGLHILPKRSDGFHNIETVFYPLPLTDVLEIRTIEGTSFLTNTGISTGNPQDNLCMKAYDLLKLDFPKLPEIEIHLHKLIPIGAGLGGGSSDAAFALKLLNQQYELGIAQERLYDYAQQLGSDCSFFLLNKPCFAQGRGDLLEETDLSLTSYPILLANPGINISTREIFQRVIPKKPVINLKEIMVQPVTTWKSYLVNDFEKIVFSLHPEIKALKEKLYAHGALYASMTGTGSTVFGIFKKEEKILFPDEKKYYFKWLTPSSNNPMK